MKEEEALAIQHRLRQRQILQRIAKLDEEEDGKKNKNKKRKKPAGNSPDHSPPSLQLIDLSGCDDLEPRTGLVSPHQVGYQVNFL